jgi:ABC-type Fe3+ transport system permease subunit
MMVSSAVVYLSAKRGRAMLKRLLGLLPALILALPASTIAAGAKKAFPGIQ